MKNKKIIIGSRGSKLALLYAEKAKKSILKNNPELNKDLLDIKIIKTTGDINQTQRLSDIGGKGLFSKKIEEQLLNKNIDIAVHALKDLPSIETKNLIVDVYLKRADPREILISKNNKNFYELENKSIIGTSSFRREAQIKQLRKDLIIKLIRGNVDTRIRKLEGNEYDAIVLAFAGIKMLAKEEKISQIFSVKEILPSVGQGIIAIQSRINDKKINNIIKKVNHKETYLCALAEREMLKVLGGDCETAVAGLATIKNKKIFLNCELFSIDGKKKFTFNIDGKKNEAKKIGHKAGLNLISQAGDSYKVNK
jgi:hydroxymethylbilane synthase